MTTPVLMMLVSNSISCLATAAHDNSNDSAPICLKELFDVLAVSVILYACKLLMM